MGGLFPAGNGAEIFGGFLGGLCYLNGSRCPPLSQGIVSEMTSTKVARENPSQQQSVEISVKVRNRPFPVNGKSTIILRALQETAKTEVMGRLSLDYP